jgi:4-hydroxy-tetrahydrodipicolinate reductase
MHKKIRVIQFGVGPIGLRTVEYLSEKHAIEIVGAIDADPRKIGADLGELAGFSEPLGVVVRGDAAEVLSELEADVVILTTTSSLQRIHPQVLQIVASGKNVVSSCEELTYPWFSRPEMAADMDRAAKENGVSVLSTGVNPGFLMDFLPLVVSGVCREVRKVVVERIQNAQFRRLPFQKKIGAGLTVEEFNARVAEGVLRHVGLPESMHMIASGLGWCLDEATDTIAPVIAQGPITTPALSIEPGRVSGVRQIGRAFAQGREVINLVFQATVGEANPRDRIILEGSPHVELSIKDGINGDIATCAILVNAIPILEQAAPGLRTMADIGIIPFMGRC